MRLVVILHLVYAPLVAYALQSAASICAMEANTAVIQHLVGVLQVAAVIKIQEYCVEQHTVQVENTVVILEVVHVLLVALAILDHRVGIHIVQVENTVVIQPIVYVLQLVIAIQIRERAIIMEYVKKEKRPKGALTIAHMDAIETVFVIQKMEKIKVVALKIVRMKEMGEKILVQCNGHLITIQHLQHNRATATWQTGIAVYQM